MASLSSQVIDVMFFGFSLHADHYVPAFSYPVWLVSAGSGKGLCPTAKAGSLSTCRCSDMGDSSLAL